MFSRECPFDLDQLVEFRKEYGFKLVVDVDDHWYLYPRHILYDSWRNNGTSVQIMKSLVLADYITTTHDYLRDKVRTLVGAKPIGVLPNALPYGKEQFTDDKVDTDNIVYSCGITHLEDIKTLRRFFELCNQNGDIQKYKFCVAGFNASNQRSHETWLKIEKEAKLYGNYNRWESLPLETYMNHYKYAKIAIAPLQDNEFNKSKSNLKIIEAACKNIPMLASDMHPYTAMPGLLLCKTQRDWYNNLKMLVRNPDKMKEHGNTLGEYVRENYNLDKINKIRKQLYDKWSSN